MRMSVLPGSELHCVSLALCDAPVDAIDAGVGLSGSDPLGGVYSRDASHRLKPNLNSLDD